MNTKTLILIALITLSMLTLASCELDPWVTRGNQNDTDIVTITKTTRYGTNAKGEPYFSRLGQVKMSHKTHKEAGMECIDCHHKKGNDSRIKTCAKCHTGDNGFNTMHGLCLDCHIQVKNGIEECMMCH